MRIILTSAVLLFFLSSNAQIIDSLNTAKGCRYMTEDERKMIYEINRLRSNPRSYLQYVEPLLKEAKAKLKEFGKGDKNYSLTFSTITKNGKEEKTIDTTWHYLNEEEVRALNILVSELKKLKPMPILRPDSGVYNAAMKHALDNDDHDWKLMHTGTDGSHPWDRIKKYSPKMVFGNENIAARTGTPSPRDIVLILLIDSGIPGYGHRYNLLNPHWTFGACVGRMHKGMYWWIQNFANE